MPSKFMFFEEIQEWLSMCLDDLTLMATLSRVGANMSVNLGLYVGGGCGCLAGDLWRGFGVFRSARMGRSGVADTLAIDRAFVHRVNLHEWRLWPLQRRQSRFRDFVVGLQELSCSAALGGRRLRKFSRYASIARSPQNSVWALFNHSWEESPSIISSTNQDWPVDDIDPPPLFMGNQLKRFSHFRDGIVHWCRNLEVKKDTRNYGQEVLAVEDQCSSPRTQIVENPGADAVGTDSSDITVICFDIETTGFSATNDRIIEFAARDLAGGVCSTIETLVNPGREVRNEHVHHISTRMVNNAGVPKWKDVALALVDFVESRRKGKGLVILVAHNGKRFDVPFIMNEFCACGVSMPRYWRFADSIALAKLVTKGSTALGQLLTYYNLPSVEKAHRAMADVNMLAQVLQKLMNDLEMSTRELLEQSFSANEIVLKGKDSKKKISSEVVDRELLDSRNLVDSVKDSVSGSVPWDLVTVNSGGQSYEDEFETTLGVKYRRVWNTSRKQFLNHDNGPSFQIPEIGSHESGLDKQIVVQRIRRPGATPLRRDPPRVVRTPVVTRPKKLEVKRDTS